MRHTRSSLIRPVEVTCVGASDHCRQIHAELVYDPQDPFAVSVVFRTELQTVTWTFARCR